MRIFHFINHGGYSGAENVIANICLLDDKNEHFYVSQSGQINHFLDKYKIPHVPVKKLNFSGFRKILKENQIDVIQAHDFKASYLAAANFRLLRKKGIRLISHIHNTYPEMQRISARSLLYYMTSKAYDHILMVSKAIYDEYIFRHSVSKKYSVLSNIVNKPLIEILSKEFETKRYDICFIARLIEQKNPILFLQIIKEITTVFPRLSVCMIGDGYLKKDCEDFINEHDLQNNVSLIGFSENPYPYLKNSKLFVLTSSYEGFGLVALEALCLGKPTVVSKVGGLVNIVTDDCGKLCGGEKDFIDEIIKLLSDETYYHKKANKTTFQTNKINDLNKYIKRVQDIYEL